ncbi:glycosyltransferase family 2 protein [Providencia stuartii]|uniref:glycosyltransferase family 2 protein n=1 Tax=Providencia TaxID=586 RepID=UPI00073C07CC|nr:MULTISPECIES: glycosyltransferase family A protein [Providencia]KSX95501.1 hypothetical protein APT95_14845 [Providencia stuartii]
MNSNYSVSVIITTKNRKLFLQRAIKSILSQSLLPEEIIIIDDNSNESEKITLSEIEKYKKGNNINFFTHYNELSMGGNYSRNKGFELSSGDIIMFLDDDDYWLPNKIEDQVNIFTPKTGLVYTGKQFVSSKNLNSILRLSKENFNNHNDIWCGNFPGSTSGVAINRNFFCLAGKFDERLNSLQDYDLWIRIINISNAYWDKKYNLIYTIHDNSKNQISSNVNKHIESIKYIKNKYQHEIEYLPFRKKRIFLSRMEHIIARAYRRNNDIRFFKHYLKSLFFYPSLRTFILPFYYK